MKKHLLMLAIALYSGAGLAGGWSDELVVDRIFTEDSDLIVAYVSGGAGIYKEVQARIKRCQEPFLRNRVDGKMS